LAEFVALRQEIERRSTAAHTLMALQLTTAAVVFSFAAAAPSRGGLLVIIPFSSYLISTKYTDELHFTFLAAQYITTELSPRIPGGLGWEPWLHAHADQSRTQRALRLAGLWLAFPAVSGAAAVWAATYFYSSSHLSPAQVSAVTALWIASLASVPVSGWVLWQLVYVTCDHPAGTSPDSPEDAAVVE
jgi:hypothetical protein